MQEGNEQGPGEAQRKNVSGKEGPPVLDSAERLSLDLANQVVGDQNDWL
mgnify:CR=1 FL=1